MSPIPLTLLRYGRAGRLSRGGAYLSTQLNLALWLALWLLWLIELCGNINTLPMLVIAFIWPGSFYFLSHGTLSLGTWSLQTQSSWTWRDPMGLEKPKPCREVMRRHCLMAPSEFCNNQHQLLVMWMTHLGHQPSLRLQETHSTATVLLQPHDRILVILSLVTSGAQSTQEIMRKKNTNVLFKPVSLGAVCHTAIVSWEVSLILSQWWLKN